MCVGKLVQLRNRLAELSNTVICGKFTNCRVGKVELRINHDVRSDVAVLWGELNSAIAGQITRTYDNPHSSSVLQLLQGEKLAAISKLMPCTASHYTPLSFTKSAATCPAVAGRFARVRARRLRRSTCHRGGSSLKRS